MRLKKYKDNNFLTLRDQPSALSESDDVAVICLTTAVQHLRGRCEINKWQCRGERHEVGEKHPTMPLGPPRISPDLSLD